MEKDTTYVALDDSKRKIVAGILRPNDTAPELREIANDPHHIRRLLTRLQRERPVSACYEAGVSGYDLYRQLRALGVACHVIAPALTPRRPGRRIKTDRRDAAKLVHLYRAGELTAIHVPDEVEEGGRDLIRCGEQGERDGQKDQEPDRPMPAEPDIDLGAGEREEDREHRGQTSPPRRARRPIRQEPEALQLLIVRRANLADRRIGEQVCRGLGGPEQIGDLLLDMRLKPLDAQLRAKHRVVIDNEKAAVDESYARHARGLVGAAAQIRDQVRVRELDLPMDPAFSSRRRE